MSAQQSQLKEMDGKEYSGFKKSFKETVSNDFSKLAALLDIICC